MNSPFRTLQSPPLLCGVTAPKHLSVLSNPLPNQCGRLGGFLIPFAWREKPEDFPIGQGGPIKQ